MEQVIAVLVSSPSEQESLKIARALIDERLAACANIIPTVRSIYRWEEKICDDSESYLIIKTRQKLLPVLEERIKTLHSYDVPEIIALPVVGGFAPYLEWVCAETQPH